MKHSSAQVLADEVLGPRVERGLVSPKWKPYLGGRKPRVDDWEIEVLKYRPGRRTCLKLSMARSGEAIVPPEASEWILKVWYNSRGQRIFDRLALLNRALVAGPGHHPPSVPNPLFYDAEAHALVYPLLEGIPLTVTLRRGTSRVWVGDLARSLALLHAAKVPGLTPRRPEDELEHLGILREPAPSKGSRIIPIDRLLDELAESKPAHRDEASLHRDFHDQQILRASDGSLVMIDLDDMARGDPCLDLGNFCAHLHLIHHWRSHPAKRHRTRLRLLREYGRATGEAPEAFIGRYIWYEAVALARLSLIQSHRARPDLASMLREAGLELLALNSETFFLGTERDRSKKEGIHEAASA